jgi:hypothetical protein
LSKHKRPTTPFENAGFTGDLLYFTEHDTTASLQVRKGTSLLVKAQALASFGQL